MQIAQVCSRWWAFKIAKRCGRVCFSSFDTETGHSVYKDRMSPAAVLDKRNLKMMCVKRYRQGKVWPERQPRCIPPGVKLCLFLVYGKKWDQGWTNEFSLLKSFWSTFLNARLSSLCTKPPKAFRGMLVLSPIHTPPFSNLYSRSCTLFFLLPLSVYLTHRTISKIVKLSFVVQRASPGYCNELQGASCDLLTAKLVSDEYEFSVICLPHRYVWTFIVSVLLHRRNSICVDIISQYIPFATYISQYTDLALGSLYVSGIWD